MTGNGSLREAGAWPVFAVFFLEAFVIGNWIPRIPYIKEQFNFSASQLGFNLLLLSFGTLIAFVFVGWFIRKLGLRRAGMMALPAWTILIFSAPLMPNAWLLGLILVCAGTSVGIQEVTMNTAAENVARETGHQIMSRAHGCWSLGTLAGALVGSGSIVLGMETWAHFLALMPSVVVVSVWASLGLQNSREAERNLDEKSSPFKLPRKSIALLCVMPIGIMLVEGAFIDWSAIFVKSVLLAGPIATALIYSAFSLVMALTRLNGDWLIDQYGATRVARLSAVSATVGIALFALAPNTTVAFFAALLAGLGVAIVYPICVTAAARRPGNAEDNVAALSLFAFCSFMVAPPLIGFVTDWTGLRIGLLLIVPLAASSYLLSGELEKKVSDS